MTYNDADDYMEWKSVNSWEGDDPKEADTIEISTEVTGYYTGSGETYARIRITDDQNSRSMLYLYKDDHVLAPYEDGDGLWVNEYFVGGGIVTNSLTNYNIFGKVSEVKIETVTKPVSGNSIDLRLFYIDFY